MVAGKSFAQSSLLATLSHEGNISVFHGATALKEAMVAAEHGDIITLSSGRYDAVTIDKAVTLRGAGMEEDVVNGTQPTRIVGSFDISIPDDATSMLSMEGIYNTETITIRGTLNNAIFQKSSFSMITCSNSDVNSLTVVHCKMTDIIRFAANHTGSGSFINCYIYSPDFNKSIGSLEFTNCFIDKLEDGWSNTSIRNSVFTNCFLRFSSYNGDRVKLHDSNMCYNCVSYGNKLDNVSKLTNTVLETEEAFLALFKEDTFYELMDDAKNFCVGNDGTEVGLYGGNLPFSTHILSPQITKCNVAAKTTVDGKLSVDIEVKAAE